MHHVMLADQFALRAVVEGTPYVSARTLALRASADRLLAEGLTGPAAVIRAAAEASATHDAALGAWGPAVEAWGRVKSTPNDA